MNIIQIFWISRTRPENKAMFTNFVYHALGLREHFYKTLNF